MAVAALSLAGFLIGALQGRPVLAAITGLLLGLFGGLELVFLKMLTSGTPLLLVLPVALLVVGAVVGMVRHRANVAV